MRTIRMLYFHKLKILSSQKKSSEDAGLGALHWPFFWDIYRVTFNLSFYAYCTSGLILAGNDVLFLN